MQRRGLQLAWKALQKQAAGFGPQVEESRSFAVLAWGRNAEGQAGIESQPVVTHPQLVVELSGHNVRSLAAGKLASAAVVAEGEGEAWSWGDGACGKLGHGSGADVPAPTRVEALVGRASVSSVALGDHHALFLDDGGSVWACGENKEGQCGLGTPLEVIASQHRQAFFESLHGTAPAPAVQPGAQLQLDGRSLKRHIQRLLHKHHGRTPSPSQQQQQQSAGPQQQSAEQGSGSGSSPGNQQGSGQQVEQQMAGTLEGLKVLRRAASGAARGFTGGWSRHRSREGIGGGGVGGPSSRESALLSFGGADMMGMVVGAGLAPGQVHTPLRIGRDQHPVLGDLPVVRTSQPPGSTGSPRGQQQQEQQMRVVTSSGLERETVIGVAAARHFSVAVTASGEVWTWGAGYTGQLGTHSSWSTSAQKVSGSLAQAIADAGGAVRVAAANNWVMALTATGRVLLWGEPPAPESQGHQLLEGLGTAGASLTLGSRVLVGEIKGLPVIRHIAAGQQHALLSDGERVWVIGKTMDQAGKEVGELVPWDKPQQVLAVPEGITQITAGMHSSGVVTTDGQLYLWGRILDYQHAHMVHSRWGQTRWGGPQWLHGGHERRPLPASDDKLWSWAGWGGPEPRVVPGLDRVVGVALGGWHVLVQTTG